MRAAKNRIQQHRGKTLRTLKAAVYSMEHFSPLNPLRCEATCFTRRIQMNNGEKFLLAFLISDLIGLNTEFEFHRPGNLFVH
jgi:hypothetical protein